jgi:hypothetical protein
MSDNSSIHIGSMVVCIRDDFYIGGPPHRPYKGQILTVRDLMAARDVVGVTLPAGMDPDAIYLRFVEIVNPEVEFLGNRQEDLFAATWFRPCSQDRHLVAFDKHLMPLKDHVVP